MRDLAEFLREHPIDVDLRVVSWSAEADSSYNVTMAGNPWWRSSTERQVPDVQFVIRCEGVRNAHFAASNWHIDADDLVVEEDAPEIWACGTHATLFGNSSLRDPARFFIKWWDLTHALRAEEIAELDIQFVPFAHWAERVSENPSYSLLRGPLRLLQEARPLLEEQGVEYQLIPGPDRSTKGLRLVSFGSSWLVCENAAIKVPGDVTQHRPR